MTWDADKQLVRGSASGEYNLAIGDPIFLREVMGPYYPRHYPADLSYPDIKPSEELMHELRKLHPKGEIVVTLGAKQALIAAVVAYDQVYDHYGVFHGAPHWPSYPTVARRAELAFYSDSPRSETTSCISSPNNPDGRVYNDNFSCHIWDAAYATAAYSEEWVESPRAAVSVWSGGKMFGASGIRVGWLVTADAHLAEVARRYVEQTTSGVPTTSQHHLAATLRNTENVRAELFEQARARLDKNRNYLWESLGDHLDCLDYGQGMFAWAQARHPIGFAQALTRARVLLVSGAACGDPTPGRYRISLGQNVDVHKEALTSLRKELER